MLKIIINNQEVDLGTLKHISLKYSGGIFEINEIIGSYSVPFSLPMSDINRHIFEFPYRIGNIKNEIREYPAEIWHSGIKIVEGILTSKDFTEETIPCNINVDNGNLFKQLKGVTLDKQNYGGPKPYIETKIEYNFLTDDYLLYPVENLAFCNGTTWEEDWIADDYLIYANQNAYTDLREIPGLGLIEGFIPVLQYQPCVITPFPLLWRTLRYLFTNLGFSYEDGFFTQDDYNTLTIFNVNNAVQAEVYTEGVDKKTRNILPTVDIANHLPEMDSSEFLKSLQAYFNISFQISNYSIKVIDRKEMIDSSIYADLTNKVEGSYTKKFIEILTDGIAINVQRDEDDENVKGWEELSEYPASKIVDAVELYDAAPNEIVLSPSGTYGWVYWKFYHLSEVEPQLEDDIWVWRRFPDNETKGSFFRQSGFYSNNKEFAINTNITPVPDEIMGRGDYTYPAKIPKATQKGNSYVNTLYNIFSLRLLFYNGMLEAQHGSAHNNPESIIQPVASDKLNGKELNAYWMFKNRWEKYFEWYKTASKAEFTMNIALNAAEIKNFDFAEKKKIGNNLYFITKFDVQIGRSEIKPAKCTMIQA